MRTILPVLLAGWLSFPKLTMADQYTACPLIKAYYPPPTISESSKIISQLNTELASSFDQLIHDGGSELFGAITPNTTSFSVVLFGGSNVVDETPNFFEYHYTSPEDQSDPVGNLTADTRFPVGDLTMVFAVYAWLIEMGEQWESPITDFLPELKELETEMGPNWDEVTIGALAGQLSGLVRESYACTISSQCDKSAFLKVLASETPVFLPDTTPMVSYAAFQLLALAIESQKESDGSSDFLKKSIFDRLNMTDSEMLHDASSDVFGVSGLNMSQYGEPAALSLVTSIGDLAKAGNAILASKLLPQGVTRRWLQSTSTDTSNLRNGVGRPWEIYRSGINATSPVLDILTKSGTVGKYASYFGLIPDFQAGFAIVAHDSSVEDRKLDLNVYADVVSMALGNLQKAAALQLATQYAGTFEGKDSLAVLNLTKTGPGLVVEELQISGKDLRADVAEKLNINVKDLDFRLYPTNVKTETKHQYVAVFQDISAPVDMGTPTCITWQEVGALHNVDYRFMFELGEGGVATKFSLLNGEVELARA